MHKGTVKWFNVKKGYGFIQSDAASKDIFVHVTSLQQSGIRKLSDGQMVRLIFLMIRDVRPQTIFQ